MDPLVQEYKGAMARVAIPSRRPFVGVAALSAILTGCAVGPNFHAPSPPASTRFTETALPARTAAAATPGGEAQHLVVDRDIPGEWWSLFHSPQITALVTQALKANPDVAAVQASLRQARETRRAEQGAFFPQVSAGGQVERQRELLAGFGIGNGAETFTTYGAALNVSYTLDAFGGIRRQVEQWAPRPSISASNWRPSI